MGELNLQKRAKALTESGAICTVCLFLLSIAGGFAGASVKKPGHLFPLLLACALFLCGVFAVYWKFSGTLTEGRLVALLFLMAFAARLCYILLITVGTNQHDVSSFESLNNNGHSGYILYLLENGKLPGEEVWDWQFYHPPLHHIVCALWLKFQTAMGISFEAATENLQILTLFYSMVALYASYRVLKLVGLRNTALFAPLCLLAFHPTFFLLSGSINNDCMSVMFCLLAVWTMLEWLKKPTFPRIAALALCIGCGMLAKLATGIIAPAVAVLFLIQFIKTKGWGWQGKGRLLLQFALFGCICIPLGIGWQVRNYLLYQMPLTYVPRLSDNSKQYLGNYSTFSRFFDFGSLSDYGVFPMRAGVNKAEYYEHCIPLAIQKMSLFGEYSNWTRSHAYDAVGTLLFYGNAALIVGSISGAVTSVVSFFRTHFPRVASEEASPEDAFLAQNGFGRLPLLFFLLYWLTMLVSYVRFCFAFPHFCSMDFRYIVPTLLIGAVFFGAALRRLEERRDRLSVLLKSVLLCGTAAFCICSLLLYPFYY
ncbi:MAG: glycosyltransferase family 39 protein [Oscillospiraceae bacterium]|nr:glycosyltransferase family 39 protein [Oscillospiraceae bacterium]